MPLSVPSPSFSLDIFLDHQLANVKRLIPRNAIPPWRRRGMLFSDRFAIICGLKTPHHAPPFTSLDEYLRLPWGSLDNRSLP